MKTKNPKSNLKNKKVPMRTCVGCRQSKPKKDLVRMVNQDGEILLDRVGKANGRGIYLCDDKDCFEKAIKKNAIGRSLNLTMTDEKRERLFKEFFGE